MTRKLDTLVSHARAILRSYAETGFNPAESTDHAVYLAYRIVGDYHDDGCIDRTTCRAMIDARDRCIADLAGIIASLQDSLRIMRDKYEKS